MSLPSLPVELSKDGRVRTASTPADYWNLIAQGFSDPSEDSELSPQQKGAITRRKNREQAEGDQQEAQETSHDGPDTTDAGTNQS